MEWTVGTIYIYISSSHPCMLPNYFITSFSPSSYLEEPIKKRFSVCKERVREADINQNYPYLEV